MITLAALIPTGSEEPSMLPGPGFLERTLFEEPLPGAIVMVAVGLVAAVFLHRSGRGGAAVAAGCLGVFLGAATFLLALAVTTEREDLQERARRAVASVMASDAAAVESGLGDGVTLTLLGRLTPLRKADIVARVKANTLRSYGVAGCSVGSAQAVIDSPGSARTQLHVSARSDLYGVSAGSWWVLHWRRDTQEQWKIVGIECQQIDGVPRGTPIDVR